MRSCSLINLPVEGRDAFWQGSDQSHQNSRHGHRGLDYRSQNRISNDATSIKHPLVPVRSAGVALALRDRTAEDRHRRSYSAAHSRSAADSEATCDGGLKEYLRLCRVAPGIPVMQSAQQRHRQHLRIRMRPSPHRTPVRRVLLERRIRRRWSRRQLSIQRSASPFCPGDHTLVRFASSPAAVKNATASASNFGLDPRSPY